MSADLLIGFAPHTPKSTIRRVLDRLDADLVQAFPDGPLLVRPGDSVAVDRLLPSLRRLPAVRYAERDRPVRVESIYPSDSEFPGQWALNSAKNLDIDAPEAWQITTGTPSTIVAVVDSGLDLTHPDLVGRAWVNPGEITGNGLDDDRNGFVDDIHGWNFLENNSDIHDEAGHGTHVAGIIAATGNTGGNAVGVNWQARVMPLKFIDAAGDGSISDAVRAIYYAAQNGARVINASWGGPLYSKSLADAVRFAGSRGAVFVTAAGNESVNSDRNPSYPASLKAAHVLAVAAINAEGRLAGFSNYGKRSVDIAAPGVNIRSSVPGGYGTLSGTSMAAPFVSGVASLVAGQFPALSAARIARRIIATARALPSLAGRVAAGGIVNALRALDPSAAVAAASPGQLRRLRA
jgi:subtilisin family serine protease